MALELKTETQILADLIDNEDRVILPSMLRDWAYSQRSVGGTMHGAGDQAVTTSWTKFKAFTHFIGTKGLTADHAEGEFVVGPGADGSYAADSTVSMSFPASGRVKIALVKNGALTSYRAVIDVVADKIAQFTVCGTGNVVEGDRLGLAITGSGAATGSVASCQFRAFRF